MSNSLLNGHVLCRFGGPISGLVLGVRLFLVVIFYISHYEFDFLNILTSLDDQQFNT